MTDTTDHINDAHDVGNVGNVGNVVGNVGNVVGNVPTKTKQLSIIHNRKTYEQFQVEQDRLNREMEAYHENLDRLIAEKEADEAEDTNDTNGTNDTNSTNETNGKDDADKLEEVKLIVEGHDEMIQRIQKQLEQIINEGKDLANHHYAVESQFNDYKKRTDERVEKLAKLFLSISNIKK
jgi:uncharacterized protein YukE